MLKEEIIKLIDTQNSINKDKIKSLLLPSLKFKLDDSVLAKFSSSKIGGYPPIFEEGYPSYNGIPLTFLGQISLDQISSTINSLLPKSGLLYFFLLINHVNNRYPDRKNEYKVLYKKNAEKENIDKKFPKILEFPISFFEHYTFPSYQENVIVENKLTDEDLNFIEDIESEIQYIESENFDVGHQVLGHPKAIQGTLRFWWAAKYLGFENIDTLTNEEIKKIKQIEDKFILLLQLDFSDPKIIIDDFGSSIAYFGIHKKDLENEDFDNVILVMQNT
ncbi:MAG: YwqG family protein [Pedobacter sp.]|jgi:uncharacterized protein YwqG|uniref:DUF1963 domain-containing protein n=1 Tax=Pedobacter sp. TaxID=1411316 RepID=UPI00356774AA